MMFAIRFDFRNPEFAGTSMADRYAAAVDMAEWADRLGATSVILSEHHGSADGYLPSPLPIVAAMAARTTNVRFNVAAMVAPFHDPLRLAEDISVVDHITKGRLDVIITGGYVRDEFAMFGVDMKERPKRVTEVVTTLKQAFTGEPFEFRGRTVMITQPPFQPGGRAICLGGSREGAARRAAGLGYGFWPS
jgi:alkanesulfonate monooxygenase SsuD/methylene tetrahydromethanopterin reductase-like flavin-dependent oxidoreductase (luciferase family)